MGSPKPTRPSTPKSVIEAINSKYCGPFWNETDSNDQFKQLVSLDNEILRKHVESLLRGKEIHVDMDDFDNDLATLPVAGTDATLAAMVHLGYLSYIQETECTRIPNVEIRRKLFKMMKNSSYSSISWKIAEADDITKSTLRGEEQKVADSFRKIHYAYADPKVGKAMPLVAVSYDADKPEQEHYCKIENVQLPKL